MKGVKREKQKGKEKDEEAQKTGRKKTGYGWKENGKPGAGKKNHK